MSTGSLDVGGRPLGARAAGALRRVPGRGLRALPDVVALRGRPGGREVGLALLLGIAAAFATFGYHVFAGGRYLDDWWMTATVRYPEAHGFASSWQALQYYSGWRPGAVAFWWSSYGLLGAHDELHRVLAAGLAGLSTATFYLLLRTLRLSPPAAVAISLLGLVSPLGDSVHLWITPGVSQVGLSLCFVGFTLALRALDGPGGRRGLVRHLPALACFAASLAVAEVTAPLLLCSVLLYGTRTRARWRPAIEAWLADVVLAVVVLGYYISARPDEPSTRLAPDSVSHGWTIISQALALVLKSLVPVAGSEAVAAVVVVVALGAAAGRGLTLPREDHRRRRVLGALGASAAAAVITLATYLPYVPSVYSPDGSGIDNRLNVIAVWPIAVLLCAVVVAVASAIDGPRRRRPLALAAAAVMFLTIFGAYAVRLGQDQQHWTAAAGQQHDVLTAMHEIVPRPAHGTTFFVFGAPGVATRIERIGFDEHNVSVPVFSTWWELQSALRVTYDDGSLRGYPIWADQPPQIACGLRSVYFLGLDGVKRAASYRKVLFIDLFAHGSLRIDDQAQCRREADRTTAGFARAI